MRNANRSVTKTRLINRNGFTLVEILISLAINSIVILAVVSLVSNAMMAGKGAENRQELATDFGLLQNYFARVISNACGMSLPPESAFWVENDCAARPPAFLTDCSRSDRLSVASSDAGPVCTIASWNNATHDATFPYDASNVCCLITTPVDHQNVMFVSGFRFRQLWVSSADTVNCTAHFLDGPMASHDNTTALYNWTGALLFRLRSIHFI